MKKTKKLASLFLALVMALSVMAVTAAACGEDGHVHDEVCCGETVQPRGLSPGCGLCGSTMTRWGTETVGGTLYVIYKCTVPGCSGETYIPAP